MTSLLNSISEKIFDLTFLINKIDFAQVEISLLSELMTYYKQPLNSFFRSTIPSLNEIIIKLKTWNSTNESKHEKILSESDIKSSIDLIKQIQTTINKAYQNTNTIYNNLKEKESKTKTITSKISNNISTLHLENFKQNTELFIKEYSNRLSLLTESYESRLKGFHLDQEKVSNSANLLNQGVDAGLKTLNLLNERIQKLELNLASEINKKSEAIQIDLEETKIKLMNDVDILTSEANDKIKNIENLSEDLKALSEKKGTDKLTKDYKEKSEEEKTQYETYRKFTSYAIGAAIVCTIVILTIPLVEYWGATPPVDTNYYTILARLTISLMFFVLALYFSKQASKHYECYQENHRTFLQLAALEPFMARMTPDEQKEIRKSLIPSYFNQNADGKYAVKGDEVGLPESFTVAFEKLVETVKEIQISQNSSKPNAND